MSPPTFSIIIPTYGRPEAIARCVASMTELDYPKDQFEVIVVDDGSPHPLDAAVEPYRDHIDLKLIRQDNAGPASARNTGAKQAGRDFLAFTDDDCVPMSDWLRRLADQFQSSPQALLGGSVQNVLTENAYASASQHLIGYLYEYFNPDPQNATFFTSNNVAISRELFLEFGGFDTQYRRAAAEDREFCERWIKQGRRMIYVPQARMRHAHHLTMRQFWRQHFNYGRGAFLFHQLRAHRGQEPLRVEPMKFYLDLLSYPSRRGLSRANEIGILLWISQAANALGFFWEKYHGDGERLV